MNSNELTLTNVHSSVVTPVTNVIAHETYTEVYTDAFSVRFEKVGEEFVNGDFKVNGDLSTYKPAEPAPAAEVAADESAETVADTTAAVDPAAEGGDTTVVTPAEDDIEGDETLEVDAEKVME